MNAVEMNNTDHLPSFSLTWDRPLPQFEEWKKNKDYLFNSEDAALHIFLHELLQDVNVSNVVDSLDNFVNAITEKTTLQQSYIGELLHAYFALSIAGDPSPARRFVSGYRLTPGLHKDYVQRTRCYG